MEQFLRHLSCMSRIRSFPRPLSADISAVDLQIFATDGGVKWDEAQSGHDEINTNASSLSSLRPRSRILFLSNAIVNSHKFGCAMSFTWYIRALTTDFRVTSLRLRYAAVSYPSAQRAQALRFDVTFLKLRADSSTPPRSSLQVP